MLVRLLDLGTVRYVESQTIYHAIGYSMSESSPETITFMSPDRPYVSIGFLQDLEKEIDLGYCGANDIPVLRREVGGGAVFLDSAQVFVHFVFHRERLPRAMEKVYELFIRPIVETYQHFGVQASHRPVNDIVVGERKIGGTGIAAIGQALVVAGSVMFDFDTATMARCLKVSSEKMRDKVFESLEQYMTTMRRELGEAPPRDEVLAVLRQKLAATLEVDLEPGELRPEERSLTNRLSAAFVSPEWLSQTGGRPRRGIVISGNVQVVEGEHKSRGGLIRVTARLREKVLEDVTLSGDFAFYPLAVVAEIEEALRGQPLDRDRLAAAVGDVYDRREVQSPGTAPEDFAEAVLAAAG